MTQLAERTHEDPDPEPRRPGPARLLYLGGHPLLREALAAALSTRGVALRPIASIAEALLELDVRPADAVLVDDEQLSAEETISAVAAIREAYPEVRVGVVTCLEGPELPGQVIRLGASACLSKEVSLEELASSLDRVLAGETVVDPTVTRSLFQLITGSHVVRRPGQPNPPPLRALSGGHRPDARHMLPSSRVRLTPVERRVMALVAEGKPNKQIGRALGLSPLTIKNHVARIRARLGASDKAQAMAMVLRHGLLDQP